MLIPVLELSINGRGGSNYMHTQEVS